MPVLHMWKIQGVLYVQILDNLNLFDPQPPDEVNKYTTNTSILLKIV